MSQVVETNGLFADLKKCSRERDSSDVVIDSTEDYCDAKNKSFYIHGISKLRIVLGE